jgi:hypothetical protein
METGKRARPLPMRQIRRRIKETGATSAYHAFISYSRVDVELAKELLVHMRRVARTWLGRGGIRVYLDVEAVTPGKPLGGRIREALDAAAALVLLAQPESAKSRWVREELQHWFGTGRPDPVMVLIGGKIIWNQAAATTTGMRPPRWTVRPSKVCSTVSGSTRT